MRPTNLAAVEERLRQLLSTRVGRWEGSTDDQSYQSFQAVAEALHSTRTIVRSLYGSGSPQEDGLRSAEQSARGHSTPAFAFIEELWPAVLGTLRAIHHDLQCGIVSNLRLAATGEVLADLLTIGKERLSDNDASSKDVAAVVVAAAFEDTIRRMGESLANVEGRPHLGDVLTALKQAGVLTGAALTTAQSYLKFRNDALHADWRSIDRATVASCAAFVEGLILTHFS